MNTQQKGIITLVKSALTGEKQALPSDFALESALSVAKRHGVTSMIYYGMRNCGISDNDSSVQMLFMDTCKHIAVSEQQMHSLKELFAAFDAAKVEYMPLKGTLLKAMYPRHEMRAMSDADILIKTEQYDIIKPIMEQLNYKERVESDHELVWQKTGSFIELHKRIIPSYNKDYYAYFGDGWQLAKIKNGTRYSMTNEDQMIYLLTHFAKHYRDGGIGIRHFTDLYLFRKFNQHMDEEYIKSELKKLCLCGFYVNILDTIDVWFEGKPANAKTDLITDVIFESGVYGKHEKTIVARTLKATSETASAKNAKVKRIIQMAFPKLKFMKLHYAFLEKLPFLLPVTWIMRLFTVFFFKRKRLNRFYDDMKNVNDQEVVNYQEQLHFVGLDFNFKE